VDLSKYGLREWESDAAMAVLRLGHAVHHYRTIVGSARYGLDNNASKAIISLSLESMTPSQLAAAVHLTPPATTELLDRLDRAGYVTRERHPTDRRKVLVSATQSGRDIVAREWAEWTRLLLPALNDGDDNARAHVLKTIEALLEIVERVNEELPARLAANAD
jgi:DNA-binding MarR family transcriptional regulator